MRSDQIHRALAQGINRFEVCQLVSKGVKAMHKTGLRFEDSINDVLQYIGTHDGPTDGYHPTAAQAEARDAAAESKTATESSSKLRGIGAIRPRKAALATGSVQIPL
jgi:hypothetical protein